MSEESKEYYILDVRSVVGNCALWWGPNSSGYVCNLDEAGLYTEQQARSHRKTDVAVPREVAERCVVKHVRLDRLRKEMPIPGSDGLFPEEREAQRAAMQAEENKRLEQVLQDALRVEPFDGDFGSPGDRRLKNKIVTARKRHACHGGDWSHECTGAIEEGERHRVLAEIIDGEMMESRWCRACTKAMGEMP